MQDIIYKLKALQSIEPDQAWATAKKEDLLERISAFSSENDVFLNACDIYAEKKRFTLGSFFPSRLAVSMTSIALILTSGILTVGASQSSLPGDPLYSVKKAGEKVKLAVASEQDKPKIEIEQAGKRLEELEKISQKTSDASQHQKVEQLVAEFQAKVDSANAHLGQLNEKGKIDNTVKVADVAKVVNEQSEKYSEVLQKTTQSLPTEVQEKVAVQVADATKTTELTNLTALLVIVESPADGQNTEELAAKVQTAVEKAETKVTEISSTAMGIAPATCTIPEVTEEQVSAESTCTVNAPAADSAAVAEEAMKELEKAKENLNNNNLADTIKSVAAVTEMTSTVQTTAAESTTTTAPSTQAQ